MAEYAAGLTTMFVTRMGLDFACFTTASRRNMRQIVSNLIQSGQNERRQHGFALMHLNLSAIRKVEAAKNMEFVLKPQRIIAAVFAFGILSACGTTTSAPRASTVEIASLPSIRVVGLNVNVPETLTVSEENSIKPRADIVWHGDPFGDRHEQVRAVIEDGLSRGAAGIQGNYRSL